MHLFEVWRNSCDEQAKLPLLDQMVNKIANAAKESERQRDYSKTAGGRLVVICKRLTGHIFQ